MNMFGPSSDTGGVQFWHEPEREGWLEKQGAFRDMPRQCTVYAAHSNKVNVPKWSTSAPGTWLRNWRRRWFILKDGKMMWFKDNIITPVRALVA